MVKLLAEHGPDVNRYNQGESLLVSAKISNQKIAQYLKAHGVKLHAGEL